MDGTTPADVLAFWFGRPGEPSQGQPHREWFSQDAGFDEAIRKRFLDCTEAALAGRLQDWSNDQAGLLALIIVLDQFPRNLFRHQAKAFAGDPAAQQLAAMALDRAWDRQCNAVERVFLYLPFEHSESLTDQEHSLALFATLANEHPETAGFLDYARRHHEVITRFGRFPHRNAALERTSTEAEKLYLAQPGSGF